MSKHLPPRPLEGHGPVEPLISNSWPRTARKDMSVVSGQPVCGHLSQRRQDTDTWTLVVLAHHLFSHPDGRLPPPRGAHVQPQCPTQISVQWLPSHQGPPGPPWPKCRPPAPLSSSTPPPSPQWPPSSSLLPLPVSRPPPPTGTQSTRPETLIWFPFFTDVFLEQNLAPRRYTPYTGERTNETFEGRKAGSPGRAQRKEGQARGQG